MRLAFLLTFVLALVSTVPAFAQSDTSDDAPVTPGRESEPNETGGEDTETSDDAPVTSGRVSEANETGGEDSETSDEDRREAAMFGEEETEQAKQSEEQSREDAMFGEEETDDEDSADEDGADDTGVSVEDFEERLAEREASTFDIGGGLFSQMQSNVPDGADFDDVSYSFPNILDLYVDGRPNSRIRAFAQGRLTHNPTIGRDSLVSEFTDQQPQTTTVALDQLYLKFDIARTVYVTAGRQSVRWGVGRLWFPNDILRDERLDPLAIFDTRTGVDLLRFHIPVEKLGWNFYAVANYDGADQFNEIGGAVRGEFVVDNTEIGIAGAARKDQPYRLSADVSTGFWLVDLRAGVTFSHQVEQPFFRGDTNLEDFDELNLGNITDLELPETYSRENDWIPQAVAGVEFSIPYGDDDTFIVGAEYFFNDFGYDRIDYYPWLILNGTFRPLYVGRHYAGLFATLPGPGELDDHSFTLSTLGNLSDQSFLSRFDYGVTVLTHLRASAFASVTYGNQGELRQGLELPGISQDLIDAGAASGQFELPDGLPEEGGFPGVDVPPTRFTIGIAASVDF
jgi:hypothetical protein